MAWALAQRQRRAYCPTCFQEDLAAGRTPYFRNDWIPVLVTACWRHGTPLFDWEMVYSKGWRRWPKSWLYKTDNAAGDIPGFMHYHLGLLAQLHASAISGSLCDGINVPRALVYLKRLQDRSEEHTSELQSLMRNSYAVFCLKKQNKM